MTITPDPPPGFYEMLGLVGFKLQHLIAGALGGLARSLTKPDGTMFRHITTAVVGTSVAGYGTPVTAFYAAKWVASPEITAGSMEGMVGFLLGLTGMSICEAAIRWAKIWRDGPPPTLPK